jgi:hypothetical protein
MRREFVILCLWATIGMGTITTLSAQRMLPAPSVPTVEPISPQFTVDADGKAVPVYLARVCSATAEQRKTLWPPREEMTSQMSFASFDLAAPTTVTVTCPSAIQSAKVLPASRGITPIISGNKLTFKVDKPGALVVEVNGDWVESLQLFADPPEQNVPSPSDPNVIYFGPGVHEVEHVDVHSGQTLYLAPGAILYGMPTGDRPTASIIGVSGSNITVRGGGIIDGSLCPRGTRPIFYATGSNIRVEGITVRDSGGWTMHMDRCTNLLMDDVKVFGWRGNSDGIDICNCQHVEVKNCYLRTFDDLIVLKTEKDRGAESDVRMHDCVLWNEFAHALSLGAELREPLSDIHFSDCDIVHDKGREWLLRVYNCDSAPVSNVSWDNIRIEEARRLMSLWIGKAIWSKEVDRGHIADIAFRYITAVAPEVPDSTAVLTGFDAAHAIDSVTFDHVQVGGKPLALGDVTQNAFVQGVSVTP